MKNDLRADALDFLEQENIGVVATTSADGAPRARFVYYTYDEEFSIYFFTYKNTRKVEDLGSNYRAAFTVANESVPRSIEIEGTVQEVSGEPTSDAIISKLMARLHSNKEFGAPLTHFDSAGMNFYKLTPTWVRFGDFTTTASKTDDTLHVVIPE